MPLFRTTSLTSRRCLPVLALAAGALGAVLAPTARADEVTMFNHVPSVEELRGLMVPEHAGVPEAADIKTRGIKTRGIEIIATDVAKAKQAAPGPEPAAASAPSAPVPSAAAPTPAAAPAPAAPPQAFGFRINFAFDSAEIPADAYGYLDAVGALLGSEPELSVVVEGHTDASGSDAYNMALSQRRAAAVAAYLAEVHQVDAARLVVRGKGESEPLTEDPYDGLNRRVQFLRAP